MPGSPSARVVPHPTQAEEVKGIPPKSAWNGTAWLCRGPRASASPLGQVLFPKVPNFLGSPEHPQHSHVPTPPPPSTTSTSHPHPSLPAHPWGRGCGAEPHRSPLLPLDWGHGHCVAPSNTTPSIISPHTKPTITWMLGKTEVSTGIPEGFPQAALPAMSLAAVTAHRHILVAAVSSETSDNALIHREGTRGGDRHPAGATCVTPTPGRGVPVGQGGDN